MVAAIRCLADAGFEVTALASSWTAPGLWSRATALRRLGPDPRRDIDGFIRRVEQLLQERRHDAVLAGTDAALFAISRDRERLILTPNSGCRTMRSWWRPSTASGWAARLAPSGWLHPMSCDAQDLAMLSRLRRASAIPCWSSRCRR